ncbi:hypothetical protein RFI_11309, partial [Reticulomyxa filosa]
IRIAWSKGAKVEIFSNTHRAWYAGEVVDILKDEEGEWLNVLWHRENNEPMSKQVQRFSADVRPCQDKKEKEKEKEKEEKEKENMEKSKFNTKALEEEIKQRRQGFKRRAPPFARTCKGVLWQYPATQSFRRRAKKLENVEEMEEEVEYNSTKKKKRLKIHTYVYEETESGVEKWKIDQVCEWLKNMGSAYEKYVPKFRSVRGSHLKQMNEDDFKSMGLPKLHAVKLSLEITKLLDKSITKDVNVDVLRWSCVDVLKWAQKHPLLSPYASKFESHGIDGILLFELNVEDLFVIGVRPSHHEQILDVIQQFSKELFPDLVALQPFLDANRKQLIEDTKKKFIEDSTYNIKECTLDKKEIEIRDNANTNTDNDVNRSKRRRQSMQIPDVPMDIQVIKDMADLLVTIAKELNVEKIQNQANLIQKKANSLVATKWPQEYANGEEQAIKSLPSSRESSQSPGKSSQLEEDGKSVTGVPLSSLEQKSKPFLNQSEETKKDAGNIEN